MAEGGRKTVKTFRNSRIQKLETMTQFKIKPVRRTRKPKYPGVDDRPDMDQILRSSILRRFSNATVAMTAMLSIGTVAGAGLFAADDDIENEIRKVDQKKVQAIVDKYLKDLGQARQGEKLGKMKTLSNNPDISIAEAGENYAIKLGDIKSTSFHVSKVKEATKELFKLYGVKIKKDQSYHKGDVEFEVDGYDKSKKIGFEFRYSNKSYYDYDKGESKNATDEQYLSAEEMKELNKQVKKGKANILVIPADQFQHTSKSRHILVKAYLQTVVDYLEWLRTEGKL